jgi:hypothetical protein
MLQIEENCILPPAPYAKGYAGLGLACFPMKKNLHVWVCMSDPFAFSDFWAAEGGCIIPP